MHSQKVIGVIVHHAGLLRVGGLQVPLSETFRFPYDMFSFTVESVPLAVGKRFYIFFCYMLRYELDTFGIKVNRCSVEPPPL